MTTCRSRMLAVAAVVCALALTLTGCSGDETDASSVGTSSPSQSAGGSQDGDAEATGAQAAGIDLDNPPTSIASVTIPGEPKADVVDTLVEVVRFEKRGKVLLAVFRVTPHGGTEETSLFRALKWSPTLVDLENLKSYSSINELTSGYLVDLVMNEPNYVMAGFAIPENTDTIDIGVSPEGLRMEGVPLP